jgi:hypothetical protein
MAGAKKKIKQRLEVFFLLSYSPERNPDEYLNCDLKQGLSAKPSPRNEKHCNKTLKSIWLCYSKIPKG